MGDSFAAEIGGGPYAAQHVGGSASVELDGNGFGGGDASLFSEITGRGLQIGVGTIAGLGYGLPMSSLYARYFGGSLNLVSMDELGEYDAASLLFPSSFFLLPKKLEK